MKKGLFFKKALPIFMVLMNLGLCALVVFLMRHVQNLLDSDVRINLTEIVTQNKDAITSRLMLNMKSLDIVSNQIVERLKLNEVSEDEAIKKFLYNYSLENNAEKIFVADKSGLVYFPHTNSVKTVDISGRKYFRLAIGGTQNISDKIISRTNGEEAFIMSVPIYYRDKIVGTVQKVYSHDEMYTMCSLPLYSAQGYIYVINSEGYAILHSGHDKCNQISDNYYRDLFMTGNQSASAQLKKDIQSNRNGFMETIIGGRKFFSAYTAIDKAHDWFLITSVPMDVVSPNGTVVIKLFYSILIVLVLIFTSSISYFLWYKNKQRANLERIAFVDAITKGHTYTKFIVDAAETLQNSSDANFYIMKFDIDNFKYINKFYGFEFGDQVLYQIDKNISRQLQKGEMIARVSSDHFVVLLRDADEERLNALLSSIEGLEIILYFSAGIYVITDKNESINLMVDKASIASQLIKGVMNKKIAYYTEEFDRMTSHNEQLKRAVKQGIEQSEFVPFYQPKVDINTGKLVGSEALARWITADGKFISPGEFVPMCEQTGQIVDIDMMIYEKVLGFLKKQLEAGIECVPVSVNFSRLHLMDDAFFDKVVGKLNDYEVPACLIELELTESAIFDNIDSIYTFTKTMHSHGLMIAMDDFGSGYSSLNMLKDVPIDILKIDKAFLSEAMDNNRRNIIFSSIVEMARKLHMQIVVEGVEFIENVDLMKECGCSIAQGYYFAKPLPVGKFEEMLVASSSEAQ